MANYYDEILQEASQFDPLLGFVSQLDSIVKNKNKKKKEEEEVKPKSNLEPPAKNLFQINEENSVFSQPPVLTQPIQTGNVPGYNPSPPQPPKQQFIPKPPLEKFYLAGPGAFAPPVTTKTKTPTPPPSEENRFWSVLRGEIDPYITQSDVQKQLDYLKLKEQAENALAQGKPLSPPTGINWIEQPDAELEEIKQGVMAGELYIKPSDFTTKQFYVKGPEGEVKKEKFSYPVGYEVYPLLPREINGQQYNVPGLKPLYYIKGDKVMKVREGFVTEGIKAAAKGVGITPEKLDETSKFIKDILTKPIIGEAPPPQPAPYMPNDAADLITGLSANLPWSYKTLTEPGGKPISPGAYPVYKETQPIQKEININPLSFGQYGMFGNVLQPLTQIPNVAVGGYPQKSPIEMQVGEKASPEEIKQLADLAEKNGLKQNVMDIVGMIAGGQSSLFTKLLLGAFAAQPWTTEINRDWTHKLAESLLNVGTFAAFAEFSPIKYKIKQGLPVTGKDIIKTIAINAGIAGGSEAIRQGLFYPNIREEDALATTKAIAYAIGGALIFDLFNLPGYMKARKITKEVKNNKLVSSQDDANLLKQIENQKETIKENLNQNINQENFEQEIDRSLSELRELRARNDISPSEQKLAEAKEDILQTIKEMAQVAKDPNLTPQEKAKEVEEKTNQKIAEELEDIKTPPLVEKLFQAYSNPEAKKRELEVGEIINSLVDPQTKKLKPNASELTGLYITFTDEYWFPYYLAIIGNDTYNFHGHLTVGKEIYGHMVKLPPKVLESILRNREDLDTKIDWMDFADETIKELYATKVGWGKFDELYKGDLSSLGISGEDLRERIGSEGEQGQQKGIPTTETQNVPPKEEKQYAVAGEPIQTAPTEYKQQTIPGEQEQPKKINIDEIKKALNVELPPAVEERLKNSGLPLEKVIDEIKKYQYLVPVNKRVGETKTEKPKGLFGNEEGGIKLPPEEELKKLIDSFTPQKAQVYELIKNKIDEVGPIQSKERLIKELPEIPRSDDLIRAASLYSKIKYKDILENFKNKDFIKNKINEYIEKGYITIPKLSAVKVANLFREEYKMNPKRETIQFAIDQIKSESKIKERGLTSPKESEKEGTESNPSLKEEVEKKNNPYKYILISKNLPDGTEVHDLVKKEGGKEVKVKRFETKEEADKYLNEKFGETADKVKWYDERETKTKEEEKIKPEEEITTKPKEVKEEEKKVESKKEKEVIKEKEAEKGEAETPKRISEEEIKESTKTEGKEYEIAKGYKLLSEDDVKNSPNPAYFYSTGKLYTNKYNRDYFATPEMVIYNPSNELGPKAKWEELFKQRFKKTGLTIENFSEEKIKNEWPQGEKKDVKFLGYSTTTNPYILSVAHFDVGKPYTIQMEGEAYKWVKRKKIQVKYIEGDPGYFVLYWKHPILRDIYEVGWIKAIPSDKPIPVERFKEFEGKEIFPTPNSKVKNTGEVPIPEQNNETIPKEEKGNEVKKEVFGTGKREEIAKAKQPQIQVNEEMDESKIPDEISSVLIRANSEDKGSPYKKGQIVKYFVNYWQKEGEEAEPYLRPFVGLKGEIKESLKSNNIEKLFEVENAIGDRLQIKYIYPKENRQEVRAIKLRDFLSLLDSPKTVNVKYETKFPQFLQRIWNEIKAGNLTEVKEIFKDLVERGEFPPLNQLTFITDEGGKNIRYKIGKSNENGYVVSVKENEPFKDTGGKWDWTKKTLTPEELVNLIADKSIQLEYRDKILKIKREPIESKASEIKIKWGEDEYEIEEVTPKTVKLKGEEGEIYEVDIDDLEPTEKDKLVSRLSNNFYSFVIPVAAQALKQILPDDYKDYLDAITFASLFGFAVPRVVGTPKLREFFSKFKPLLQKRLGSGELTPKDLIKEFSERFLKNLGEEEKEKEINNFKKFLERNGIKKGDFNKPINLNDAKQPIVDLLINRARLENIEEVAPKLAKKTKRAIEGGMGEIPPEARLNKEEFDKERKAYQKLNRNAQKITQEIYNDIWKEKNKIFMDVFGTTEPNTIKKFYFSNKDDFLKKDFRNEILNLAKQKAADRFGEVVSPFINQLPENVRDDVVKILTKQYLGKRVDQNEKEFLNNLDDKYNTKVSDLYYAIEPLDNLIKNLDENVDLPTKIIDYYTQNPKPKFVEKTPKGEKVELYYPEPYKLKIEAAKKANKILAENEKKEFIFTQKRKEILDKATEYANTYDDANKIIRMLQKDLKEEYGTFDAKLLPPTQWIEYLIKNNPYNPNRKGIKPSEFQEATNKLYDWIYESVRRQLKKKETDLSPREIADLMYEDFIENKKNKPGEYSAEEWKLLSQGNIEGIIETKDENERGKSYITKDKAYGMIAEWLQRTTDMGLDMLGINIPSHLKPEEKIERILPLVDFVQNQFKKEFPGLLKVEENIETPNDWFERLVENSIARLDSKILDLKAKYEDFKTPDEKAEKIKEKVEEFRRARKVLVKLKYELGQTGFDLEDPEVVSLYEDFKKVWDKDKFGSLPDIKTIPQYIEAKKDKAETFNLDNPLWQSALLRYIGNIFDEPVIAEANAREVFEKAKGKSMINPSVDYIINDMLERGATISDIQIKLESMGLDEGQRNKIIESYYDKLVRANLDDYIKRLETESKENEIIENKMKGEEEEGTKVEDKRKEKINKVQEFFNKEENINNILTALEKLKTKTTELSKEDNSKFVQILNNFKNHLVNKLGIPEETAYQEVAKTIAQNAFDQKLIGIYNSAHITNIEENLPPAYRKYFKKAFYNLENQSGIIEDMWNQLQINPALFLPFVGTAISQYFIPDTQKELKDFIFYSSILGGLGYLGFTALRKWKKTGVNPFRLPPKDMREINYTDVPIVNKAIQNLGDFNHPIVKQTIQKVKDLMNEAKDFAKTNLASQVHRNKLADLTWQKFKEAEEMINHNIFELQKDISKLSKKDPFILGLIDNTAIAVQRKMYNYRYLRLSNTGRYPKIEEAKQMIPIFVEESLMEAIEKIGENAKEYINKKYGGLESFKEKFNKEYQDYRNIIKRMTELNYKISVMEKFNIPFEKFEEKYQEAIRAAEKQKATLEEAKRIRDEEIEIAREKMKDAKEEIKAINSELIKAGYKRGVEEILKGKVKNNQEKIEERAKTASTAISRQEKIKTRINNLIQEIKDQNKRINKLNENYNRIVKQIRALEANNQPLIKALSPETLNEYLDNSEYYIHWNPLWHRTEGDWGVKAQSQKIGEHGELKGDAPHESSRIKFMTYGNSIKEAMDKTIEYLKSEGYEPDPVYKDLFYKDLGNGRKDIVKIKKINRKELDVRKVYQLKVLDYLGSLADGLKQAYRNLEIGEIQFAKDIDVEDFINKIENIKKQKEYDKDILDFPDDFDNDLDPRTEQIVNRLSLFNKEFFKDKANLSQLIALIQTAKAVVPRQNYRDFIGYETSDNPTKAASLLKMGLAKYLQSIKSLGLRSGVISKIRGELYPMVIDYGLNNTNYGKWLEMLERDLLKSPTSLFQKGLVTIGGKVYDAEKFVNDLSGASMFMVFLGNVGAAYKNLKYALIVNPSNRLMEGHKIPSTLFSYLKGATGGLLHFLESEPHIQKKLLKNEEVVPKIFSEPTKQKVFEDLYKSGYFNQSVFDVYSSMANILNFKDILNLPGGQQGLIKILLYKIGFFLQKNSEFLNKLISFNTKYDLLRRQGIEDYNTLKFESLKAIARDEGLFEPWDLGELTRKLKELPFAKELTRMITPAVLQNWNYFEQVRAIGNAIPKFLRKNATAQDVELFKTGLRAFGSLLILNTLLAGWAGFPVIGDLFDKSQQVVEEIDKDKTILANKKGLKKIEFTVKNTLHQMGFNTKQINTLWISMMKGVDSYIMNRDVSVDNLIGPFAKPFLYDFVDRMLKAGEKIMGGRGDIWDITPYGLQRAKNWIKDILGGEVIVKGKYFDVESGRPLDIRDYMFGLLGNHLEDVIRKESEARMIIDFYTKEGRNEFLKNILNKTITGKGKTETVKATYETIKSIDPDLWQTQVLYFTGLNIYEKKYAENLLRARDLANQFVNKNYENIVSLVKQSSGNEAFYGKAKEIDKIVDQIMRNVASYYETLAMHEALRIVYNLPDLPFNLSKTDDGDLQELYPVEEQGFEYAKRKLLRSRNVKKFNIDFEDINGNENNEEE